MVNLSHARLPVETAVQSEPMVESDRRVLLDQLIATRRGVMIALPVNVALSLACGLVAWHSGQPLAAGLWLLASLLVSGARALLYHTTRAPIAADEGHPLSPRDITRMLGHLWQITLLSGLVWACVPALCAYYTAPTTLFFIVVGCGITAGAVSHGGAYARVPIVFITPPILSAMAAMIHVGGFERNALAVTMLVYLAALIATARQAEVAFRKASRMTSRVTEMNASLQAAHDRSLMLAGDMRHRAHHDPLTGLLNRAGFLRDAAAKLDGQDFPACLMLLDLDGFKAINDAFGHQVGDDILVEVAARLRVALDPEVLISRWGGDEFAVLYSTGPRGAEPGALATRLIAEVSGPYTAFGAAARIGLSVGIHTCAVSDMGTMLSCADTALYAAKAAGRNRHYIFDDNLRAQLDVRRDIERDLPDALLGGAIELWFQPIFGHGGTTICGLEALIRWCHPVHGWVPPADLMATAAKVGLARPLMDLILDQVCTMIARLRERHVEDVCVAMNVSPREMSQLPIDDLVLAALASRQLPASALEIEITEETALDIAHAESKLAVLSRAGIRIAIDDFGVGYSSLSTLRRLNVDRIKIDRCFVSGLAESTEDQVVVKAVLSLGLSLRVDVVAEGVESAEDLRTLRALGCQFMQGYHLGRPMPMAQCLAFVTLSAPEPPLTATPIHRLSA